LLNYCFSNLKLYNRQNNVLQVDLVEGYKKIKVVIQRLKSVETPELELCDVMSLGVKGEFAWL